MSPSVNIALADKIALVTGASRGIGNGIALTLGREGAIVAGTATTEAGANRITQAFEQANIKGKGFVLNISDAQSIDDCLSSISETFGMPGILVNNAGITKDNLLIRMKEEEWDAIMETNLKSIFRLTKLCIKSMMKARWGRLIHIGSVVGSTGNPGQANYCAAKAAIMGFSKSTAIELASRGITSNVVAPGFIETDMTGVLPDAQKESLLGQIPAGRLGQPADIAAAVAFLSSPEAGYITGQTLHVNGGMYMSS